MNSVGSDRTFPVIGGDVVSDPDIDPAFHEKCFSVFLELHVPEIFEALHIPSKGLGSLDDLARMKRQVTHGQQ